MFIICLLGLRRIEPLYMDYRQPFVQGLQSVLGRQFKSSVELFAMVMYLHSSYVLSAYYGLTFLSLRVLQFFFYIGFFILTSLR